MAVGKLFSFDGRIGRGAFWGMLLLTAIATRRVETAEVAVWPAALEDDISSPGA